MLGVARSASRQRVWHDNHVLFAQTVLDAPTSYRAHLGYSLALKSQKRDREALDELRLARLIYPDNLNLLEYTAAEYSRMNRCPLAIPHFRRALEMDPGGARSRHGLAVCLIWLGQFREARSEIVHGLAYGGWRESFERLRTIADSLEAAKPLRSSERKAGR
jgi:Flp pilus assembly protein TadD